MKSHNYFTPNTCSHQTNMSVASSQHFFFTNTLTSINKRKFPIPFNTFLVNKISCTNTNNSNKDQDSPTRKNENKFAKLAMVALAAGVLTLGSVDPSLAAKSGGRVGGQAFKSSAPRSSSPRINNSRTNVYINPPVAPPLLGGYGYGPGFYGGGWGWSPFSFFAPGPAVAVSVGGGFDTLVFFLFLGAGAAVFRRFFGSRQEDDDDGF